MKKATGKTTENPAVARVYDQAETGNGTNPDRTANKSREQLKAVLAWAWDQELVDSLPRFPQRRLQRDVAGRHYLSKTGSCRKPPPEIPEHTF